MLPNTEAAIRRCTLKSQAFKKKLQHRCFPVKFAKFLRTAFLQNKKKENS